MLTKMKMLAAAGTMLMASMVAASPANAAELFGGSSAGPVTLTFDGVTPFVATDTGWIQSNGLHTTANSNYIVGNPGVILYNDYFSFVLGAAAPVSPYTSAVLSIANGGSTGPYPFDYALFDVSVTPAQLDAQRAAGDATGKTIYTDLGSGTSYGSTTITRATSPGSFTTINLNQAFLDQVNSGLLTTFSIGGTLTPTVAPAAAVPEPAMWLTMILGFGLVGGVMRRRQQKVTTRVAFA